MGFFRCRKCGETHPGPALAWGPDAPEPYYWLNAEEQEKFAELTPETCLIEAENKTHYFIRGRIEVPIHASAEVFSWLVWVSLSEENMRRTYELWDTQGREEEPPYFGWLCSRLPGYPDTMSLKTMVHTRPVGRRPYIELEPTDHPLALEQRCGIPWGELEGRACALGQFVF